MLNYIIYCPYLCKLFYNKINESIVKGKMSILERIKQIIKKTNTAQNQIIIKEISKKIPQNNKENVENNSSSIEENKPSAKKQAVKKSDKKNQSKSRQSKNAELKNINAEDEAVDFGNWDISEFQVEEKEGMLRFHDLGLSPKLMRGIYECEYKYCTPIQHLILPESLKGKDVSGKAQTGTGKTAAFLITLFTRLMEKSRDEEIKGAPRALIMAPTRELVIQIEKDARNIGRYCGLTIQSVFGGINYEKQKRQIENRNIDILVATPGRLLDYKEQGVLDLSHVEILVIDEADRMLDMGFIPDMKKIISATPSKSKRQTMLFSATLNQDILRLASQWTKDPLSFEVESKEITSENIEQIAYIASDNEKFAIIYNMISHDMLSRVIIFGNRRDEVARLTDMFKACGLSCGLLSGDVTQSRRIKTLEELRNGTIRILCATDVAARGIHVDGITHVFNYSLPEDPEDYVHRIGRTGRAGEKGVSVIFATEEDSYLIPKIESYTKHKLNYINPDESLVILPDDLVKILKKFKSGRGRRRTGALREKGIKNRKEVAKRRPVKRKK